MASLVVTHVVKRYSFQETTIFPPCSLMKVEGALLELSRKQAELESREKQLAETSGAYLGAAASPTTTALVPGVPRGRFWGP